MYSLYKNGKIFNELTSQIPRKGYRDIDTNDYKIRIFYWSFWKLNRPEARQELIAEDYRHTNTNGMKLNDFAASRDKVLSLENKLDCLLWYCTSNIDFRTMGGAYIDLDHHLVVARVRCRISSKSQNNNPQLQFNSNALRLTSTAERNWCELTNSI